VHGEPVLFGVDGSKALVRAEQTGGVKVVATADVAADDIVVHDAHSSDPTMAFAISRLTDAGYLNTSPIGIFRQVERSTYDDGAREQVAAAVPEAGHGDAADRTARLAALIGGGDTWTIL
jgi:2-oxoglutarate ferredoxin oxidoreductase subunit beta